MANNHVQRAQLAIQELLKLLGCGSGVDESPVKGRGDREGFMMTQGGAALSQHARALSRGGKDKDKVDARGQANWDRLPKDVQQV